MAGQLVTVIGITGTRNGATDAQLVELRELLEHYAAQDAMAGVRTRLHHGDCIGVDAQAHWIAHGLDLAIEVHPPADSRHRAYTVGWDILYKERPYMMRNRDIVEACDILIAVPERAQNLSARSGTWATIQMARKNGTPVHIIRAGRW